MNLIHNRGKNGVIFILPRKPTDRKVTDESALLLFCMINRRIAPSFADIFEHGIRHRVVFKHP